jgi:hypothetical protein
MFIVNGSNGDDTDSDLSYLMWVEIVFGCYCAVILAPLYNLGTQWLGISMYAVKLVSNYMSWLR